VQFAEDMVKKASQDKITDGLKKFTDSVEEEVKEYIDGILKDLLNSKKDE